MSFDAAKHAADCRYNPNGQGQFRILECACHVAVIADQAVQLAKLEQERDGLVAAFELLKQASQSVYDNDYECTCFSQPDCGCTYCRLMEKLQSAISTPPSTSLLLLKAKVLRELSLKIASGDTPVFSRHSIQRWLTQGATALESQASGGK